MIKTLAVVVLAAVTGTTAATAGSSSAQLSVSVTVVRACSVDARTDDGTPVMHLTCTSGAGSTVKVSEPVQPPSTALITDGSTVLTLNF
jgi:hypothetical protein